MSNRTRPGHLMPGIEAGDAGSGTVRGAGLIVRLVKPSLRRLPAYSAALATGWSPNGARDVSGEHLFALGLDPEAFVRGQAAPPPIIVGLPGEPARILVRRVLWIWDGEFCGAANLRFIAGTSDLPSDVSGHVG